MACVFEDMETRQKVDLAMSLIHNVLYYHLDLFANIFCSIIFTC